MAFPTVTINKAVKPGGGDALSIHSQATLFCQEGTIPRRAGGWTRSPGTTLTC